MKFQQVLISSKTRNFLLIFICISFFSSCQKENTILLTDNGTSEYEIVFKENANKGTYQSAEILQKYLQKISVISLPMVDESSQTLHKKKIYIGNFNHQTLQKEEVAIQSKNKNIQICGGSDTAIRNAVYVFLEKYLGCQWYAPNVEEIPKQKTITLPTKLSYHYIPKITTRTVHSRLFYEHATFAEQLKVTKKAFPNYVPTARVHTFKKFIPEEKFYKQHPEYFALRNGKRVPTQLCLTNEKVLQIVKDSVAVLFSRYPNATVVSVSQNDNTQYCTCVNCAKIDDEEGSHSGTMIRFVNKVANAFPDKTISTLAYQYTRKPSKTKPLKNVLITLCSIECDRSAPITEKCTDFADDIRGWNKITDNIRIWDYTTQFTNFLAPFPNLHTLQPNIQFFRDNHAKWVFEQHSNQPSELFELRSYITAKLLWNPDMNFDDEITKFTNGYYQEGGIYIKKYIDLIHQKIQEDKNFFLFLYGDPSQAFTSYLNPKLLKTYNELFDKAEKAVAQKPDVLQRVKEARLGIDFAILEAARKNLSKEFSMAVVSEDGKKIINPWIQKRLENFEETCKNANITVMNEMRFTVKEYVDNYKKTLQTAVLPNKAYQKKVRLLTKPKKYADENPQTLTDGALGGASFYANWLGFEGNDLEAVIDLGKEEEISSISANFLQVTNHIVFFPTEVNYLFSVEGNNFLKIKNLKNKHPLTGKSKINDIQKFEVHFQKIKARYIKIKARNMKKAPYWHPAAGLPSWIFIDELIIN